MGSGLLQKANLLSVEKGLAFSKFIQKYNNKVFAIFSKRDNFYFISNSLGFDGLSILSSYSTVDFWEGLITSKNKVYNFVQEDNSLNKMLQFFSFNMKEKIKQISVYFADEKIILMCNEILSDEFIHDVILVDENEKDFDLSRIDQSLVSNFNLSKYTINYIDAVDSYVELKTKDKSYISEYFKLALLKELSNRFTIYFNHPNCSVTIKDYYTNIIIFSKEKLEDELLLNHIIFNISEIIENCSELIEINYIGKVETYNDVKDFLKVE